MEVNTDRSFKKRIELVRLKIEELDLSKWGYEFSKEKLDPKDSFGLITAYFFFYNKKQDLELELIWYFDGLEKIKGDAFSLLLTNLKTEKHMNFDIYSKKHDIKLVSIEKHLKDQDYKEFVDLFFKELIIACETYLNPFITGKEWEETPFDWKGIK